MVTSFETIFKLAMIQSNEALNQVKEKFSKYTTKVEVELTLDELLSLYSEIKLQIDEVMPTNEDIDNMIEFVNGLGEVLIDDADEDVLEMIYTLDPATETSYTPEVRTKIKASLKEITDGLNDILKDVCSVANQIYASITDNALEPILDADTYFEDNDYLKNDDLKVAFRKAYADKVIRDLVIADLKKADIKTAICHMGETLQGLEENQIYASAMSLLPMILGNLSGMIGADLSGLPLDIAIDYITPENYDTIVKIFEISSAKDIETLSAEIYVKWLNEDPENLTDEDEALSNEAQLVILTDKYNTYLSMVSNLSADEIEFLAEHLEDFVSILGDMFLDLNISMIEEQLEDMTSDNLESAKEYLQEQIDILTSSIQRWEELRDNPARSPEEEEEYNTLDSQISEIQDNLEMANFELQSIENQLDYINTLEEKITQYQNYKTLLADFLEEEHDFTEQYKNVLLNIQRITNEISKEDIKGILSLMFADERPTAEDLIQALAVVKNFKVSIEDEELGLSALVDLMFADVKEVAMGSEVISGFLKNLFGGNDDPEFDLDTAFDEELGSYLVYVTNVVEISYIDPTTMDSEAEEMVEGFIDMLWHPHNSAL